MSAICNFLEEEVIVPASPPYWCRKCHKWHNEYTRLMFYDIIYWTCPNGHVVGSSG